MIRRNSHAKRAKESTLIPFWSLENKLDERKGNGVLHFLWGLIGVWVFGCLVNTLIEEVCVQEVVYANGSIVGHTRSKRFIYMSNDRQLNLPPGTVLDLESTASLPGINPLPIGFGHETAISIPFDIDFDTLGLTSEDNRFGEIPFLDTLMDWLSPITNFTDSVRESFAEHYNKSQKQHYEIHIGKVGGERSLIYQVIEDVLYNLGIDGKACLLRTICEIHSQPFFGHGLFGEILELFLTVSSSETYLEGLEDYLEAEHNGRSLNECVQYKEQCPLSLFAPLTRERQRHEESVREQFIQDESNYADYHLEGENNGNRITRDVLLHMKENHTARETLSREKRLIFFGPAGNMRLPDGSIFIIKPQLKLPWMTNLPEGYKSGLNVGIPLRVIFNDLGLTSILNPFLRIPFANVGGRKRRSAWRPLPGVNYAGGDRELIYTVLEDALQKWGVDGKSCLLRAICEMHLSPLENHGLFGEVLQLFLTPSKALHSKLRMREYFEAEQLGAVAKYCDAFYKSCPYSIFISKKEKENQMAEQRYNLEDEDNYI